MVRITQKWLATNSRRVFLILNIYAGIILLVMQVYLGPISRIVRHSTVTELYLAL